MQDERVFHGSITVGDERLTSRLEAFGDLVFGFSLSLTSVESAIQCAGSPLRIFLVLAGALR